ncbi:MAG: phage terminase, small subunit, putative, family [Verrucomicrobiales bacterium]|nr:phage terminase, small subunit, putative, family [Verrucomicrobiales bacterium]
MGRGRKAEANVTRILNGVRADRVNLAMPEPSREIPDAPFYLDEIGLDEWGRMAPMLWEMGVLTSADGPALGLYCRAFSRWHLASNDLEKNGCESMSDTGAIKRSPAAAVVAQAEAFMLRCLAEFGLTPSARARVKATPPASVDPLDAFTANARQG